MSPPYDNSKSRRAGVGHWVPLAVTVAVATVGLAAWIINQRIDDSESESGTESPPEQDLDYNQANYGSNPAYGTARGTRADHADHTEQAEVEPGSWGSRVQGALRRSPSPQQFLDNAGKTVAAGIAATGAAITNTLAAIREEDKAAFNDHETWSEEADAKTPKTTRATRDARRQTVAVVISADAGLGQLDNDNFHEHASILSHIPRTIDYDRVRFFVLIYAPGLKDHTPEMASTNKPPPSLDSSYTKIEPADALTPGSEKSPMFGASNTSNTAFNALQSQALDLVEKHTMVLPFTSSNGHVHILRHLQPDVIYLQESLSGENGSVVNHIQTWMKHEVCLVVGVEGGQGALADSESEPEQADKDEVKARKWWQQESRVGRGRGVVVVDGMRVHDDWMRRVEGQD